MSAAVVRLKLVECRAVLGGERDPMRAIWDDRATQKDRRFLMLMAGMGPERIYGKSGYGWSDLSAADRREIKAGLRKFKEWAAAL